MTGKDIVVVEQAEARPGDYPEVYADASKIFKELGWRWVEEGGGRWGDGGGGMEVRGDELSWGGEWEWVEAVLC